MIKKFNKINGKKIISVIIILVVIMNIIYNEKIIEELRKIKRNYNLKTNWKSKSIRKGCGKSM